MKYIVEYRHKSDNVGNEVGKGLIIQPLQISWEYENSNYILESKLRFKTEQSDTGGTKQIVSNSIFDFINKVYLKDDSLLVLYADNIEYNNIFPPPDNLVLYNLKKEVIKVIPPPVPIHWQHPSSIYSIGEEKIIDGRKYIEVWIGTGEPQFYAQVEARYLDLETFEYHPTEYRYNQIFQGR